MLPARQTRSLRYAKRWDFPRTEEEKREAEEIRTARREHGYRDPEQSPKFQRRIDRIVAQKGEAERRAESAEWERDELRQRLEQIEREVNAPLDRALAAESRAAELELRRRYRNPHAYKRLREAWERSRMYAVESAAAHQEPVKQGQEGRMRVGITISHPRVYDADNAVGGIKPVLDALRKVGYIGDDAETWLQLLPVRQERSAADRTSNHNRDRESKRKRSTVSETRTTAAASRCPAGTNNPGGGGG